MDNKKLIDINGLNIFKGQLDKRQEAIDKKFQQHDNILATITGSETIVFTIKVNISGTIYSNSNKDYIVTISHVSKSVYNDGSEQPFDTNVKLILERTLNNNVETFDLGNIKANGNTNINIKQYLVDSCSIRFRTISYEKDDITARTASFDVKKITLAINTQNDTWWAIPYITDSEWHIPLILDINVNCNLVATISKDGINYSTKTIGSSLLGTNYNLLLDHPSTNGGDSGLYKLKVELVPTDQTLSDIPSVFIEKNILCITEHDTNNYIIVNNIAELVDNYNESTLFNYSIHIGFGNPLVSIYSSVDNDNISVIENMSLVSGKVYSYNISLAVERETTDNFNILTKLKLDETFVSQNIIEVNNSTGYGAVSGATTNISFSGRSNNEANRHLLINTVTGNTITPEFTDLTWSEVDGYQNGFFRLLSGEKISIPIYPFKNIDQGVTFDIKFRSRNILDYNSEIIKIYDKFTFDNKEKYQGLKITSNTISFFDRTNTNSENQSFPYNSEDINIVTIVIYPNYRPKGGDSAYNALMIYLNGQKQREYDLGSNINLIVTSNIIVGSDNADIDLYAIRHYNKALTDEEIENNTCNLQSTIEEKKAYKDRNKIRSGNDVDFELVKSKFNVILFETSTGEIPNYIGWTKNTKIKGNVKFFVPGSSIPEWHCNNVNLQGQGTTSMGYIRWNIKWTTESAVDISKGLYPSIKKFCAKKNFASSMQSHKIGSTLAFDYLARLVGAIEENAPRVSIYQYPCVGFVKDNNGNYKFIGLYTVGPDKGDKDTFGFNSNSLYMEGRDNGFYGSEFRAPWTDDNVTVDTSNEKYTLNGEASWEDASKKPTYVTNKFVPAYNFVYQCNQRIAPITSIDYANDITMEYWIESTYELFRYDNINKIWISSNINLKNQLVDKGYNLTLAELNATSDTNAKNELFKKARIKKFALGMEEYFDKKNALFHEAYSEIHNHTDNKAKNTYPYILDVTSDTKIRWRRDDDDTMATIENRGIPLKQYCNEVDDNYSMYGLPAQDVYNGRKSQFWLLLRLAFEREYKAMVVNVLNAMSGGTVSGAMNYFNRFFFNNAQNYFSEALYNEDAIYCYEYGHSYVPENPSLSYGNQNIALRQLLGNHYSAEKFFFKFRYLYMCSKYSTGVFGVTDIDSFQTRPYSPEVGKGNTFVITPAIYMYPAVQFGQTVIRGERIFPGNEQKSWSYTFNKPDGDTVQRINAMSYIKSIGDIYKNSFKEDITVNGPMLSELKFGSVVDVTNIKNRATSVIMNNAASLRNIDMANLSTLAGEVNCKTCINLRSLYAENTKITNVPLCNGGPLRVLHLPATNMRLELINKKFLNDLIIESPYNLETINVQNCNDYVLDMVMEWLNTIYSE